MSESWRMPIK